MPDIPKAPPPMFDSANLQEWMVLRAGKAWDAAAALRKPGDDGDFFGYLRAATGAPPRLLSEHIKRLAPGAVTLTLATRVFLDRAETVTYDVPFVASVPFAPVRALYVPLELPGRNTGYLYWRPLNDFERVEAGLR